MAVPELEVLPASPPLEVVNGSIDVEVMPASDPSSGRVDVEPLEGTFGLPYAWLGTVTPEVPPRPSSPYSVDPWDSSDPSFDRVQLGSPTTTPDPSEEALPSGAGNIDAMTEQSAVALNAPFSGLVATPVDQPRAPGALAADGLEASDAIERIALAAATDGAESAQEDPKAIMEGVRAINQEKERQREVQSAVNVRSAANAEIDDALGPHESTHPAGRPDVFRKQDLSGNVYDRDLDVPEDPPGQRGTGRSLGRKSWAWTGLVLALVAGSVAVVSITLGLADQTIDPAAALESPSQSDLPATTAGAPGAQVSPDLLKSAEPRTSGGPAADPGAAATKAPAPQPDLTKPPSKATDEPPKATPDVQPTKPPTGEIKVTPTLFKATCQGAIEPFNLIIDNTSGPIDVAWTIEVGPGPSGPWATASATIGLLVPGQLKVVIITPGDFCKALTGTTTFGLTVKLNGAPTVVSYEVSP
jgi:hypothetical protein